jgi:hypothetical protein
MIRGSHPVIKFASYVILAAVCSLLGIWDLTAATVICAVAFAVDGLTSNVLVGAANVPPGSRWLGFIVPLFAIGAGRAFAAALGM